MSYKIVSDSASNIFDLSEVDYENVPLKIITDEKEYVDTSDLDLEGMISDLENTKGKTGTSCPNIHEWLQAFKGSDAIFAVTITSNLSGSYAAAMQAATDYMEENENAKVVVFDSLSAGPEMGLITEKIKERILAGDSVPQIEETTRNYMKHTHLSFSLQSLTNLARNGRISPAVAKIAGVLGIRVVGKASDVGTLEPLHKCRGEKKALDTIFKDMKAHGFAGGKVRIAHCFNLGSATSLKEKILAEFPHSNVMIEACTALCSFYAELGGLLVGYEDAFE